MFIVLWQIGIRKASLSAMELSEDPSFDDWVRYIFDHEVPEDAKQRWYYNSETDFWSTWYNLIKELEYLTQAFEQIDLIAESYTDEQISQALWYIVNEFFRYYMFDVLDTNEISGELLKRTVYPNAPPIYAI
jgi:hypothetical protein